MIRFLQTPGPVKKVILSAILLVFCGAMVITLIPGGLGTGIGLGGPGQGVVATVDGVPVATLEVQHEARQMLKQQFPRGGPQASMLLPFFASRAAENLINQQIVLAEAQRLGLHATDEELRDELQHGRYGPAFFPDGNFIGQEAYEARLQQADLTVAQFEEGVKQQILLDKLRNLIAGSASVTEAEVRKEFEKRNTKIKFDYAVLHKDDILKNIHPSEAELKAFYERNKASYIASIPEKRKIRYALVDTAKVQAQTPITHQDLQAYYNQHRDDFRVEEQVNIRHILLKTPLPGPDGKADPKGAEETRKKAEEVLKQLKAGAKFEDLAAKYSEDTTSAKNGGSLGWIGKGRTVPEFEKAAFALPKGGTSELVHSSYGFHIIHVDDKQGAHLKTLDEVKDQVESIVRNEKAANAADNLARMLLNQARANGLDQAAAAKGLQVVNTEFISRIDALPGIGSSPEFMEAVFSAREKSPPDEAQLPQGYAVYEVLAVKPPATPTFEEIRSRVETEFKNERSGALLSQKMQELADRAKAGHDLKKAARELGATLKTSDYVLPDGQVPEIGSLTGPAAIAFTMKAGEISGPIDSGNTVAVLSIVERQEPAPQDFDAKKDEIRDSLLQAKQGEIFALFLGNLRDQMEKSGKLKINQQEMKNLTRAPSGEEGE
jgi:peptidyl-prolyl cis-trans isomerase D